MLEFTKLILKDIDIIRPYFTFSKNMICDNSVGSAFMWRDYFEVEYAEYNDTIIFKAVVKYHDDIIAFSPPLGKDYDGSINKIVEYCHHNGLQIAFFNATEEDVKLLKTRFGDCKLFNYEDWSDYLYKAEDLTTLSGRKFSGKRNHINSFTKTYCGYSFEEIVDSNIGHVIDFYNNLDSGPDKGTSVYDEEHSKTLEALENFGAYGLLGGFLKVDDSIIAFSLGEIINNVLFVHVEKADIQYRGVYQVINNEFAKHFCSAGIDFINREEDIGDEGLRFSKKSYHPHRLIDKYIFIVG